MRSGWRCCRFTGTLSMGCGWLCFWLCTFWADRLIWKYEVREGREFDGEAGATHDQGPMDDHTQPTGTVQLPAPTAWPMVFALGISLMLAGMVTHWVISLLGVVMALPAMVGWFFRCCRRSIMCMSTCMRM